MWYRAREFAVRRLVSSEKIVGGRVTTPAQDAPLVFPSVAFQPVRLLALCAVLTAAAVGFAAWADTSCSGSSVSV